MQQNLPVGSPEPTAHSARSKAPAKLGKFAWMGVLGALLTALLFIADLWIPSRFQTPVCYVIALLLIIAIPGKAGKCSVAIAVTLLWPLDYYLAHDNPGTSLWEIAIIHGFALAMVWSVTALGVRHEKLQDSLRENERVVNERLAELHTIYTSAPVGLCFLDRELRHVSINDALAEMRGHPREHYLGKTIRESVPELADTLEGLIRRVIDTGQPIVDVELQRVDPALPRMRRYNLASYFPVHDPSGKLFGINIAVRDISGRKQAESNTLFLLNLGECIRFAADADELVWVVPVALGEHMNATRCGFLIIDADKDRCTVQRDYHPHIASLAGTYSLGALSPALIEAGRIRQTTVIADVSSDEHTAAYAARCQELGVSSLIATPLLREGKLVCALVVAASEPRLWSEQEIALVNHVAERTWLTVEKLRLVEALHESEAALRDADMRKDEFLATLAHELRNPLSLMRNVVALQQTPSAPHADPTWGRDIIERQVNYLTRLTDDLFEVSRITRDKLVLQKEPLKLAEVITAAIETSRTLIDQRGHELTVTMSQESIYVDADRLRLTQVFTNLLNNAAKYSPDPGHVWLNVEQAGDTVLVRVKDTGMGIAAENLPHVFDLFYQIDHSFTRIEGGLGLGLTLVHRLVELHGGKVKVQSEGLSRGSEFTVSLPVLSQVVRIDAARPGIAETAAVAGQGRRILVADDFPEAAETLARLLKSDSNEVQIAHDGQAAVETAEQFLPDIVLMDIGMPKLNGYEAAEKIRQQPWGKNMVLIALTGWGQRQDLARSQAAGFDAHLTKPVNFDSIMKVLANISGNTRHNPN